MLQSMGKSDGALFDKMILYAHEIFELMVVLNGD